MNTKEFIYIGKTKAIIVRFYNKEKTECEVVYIDRRGMVINEDAIFDDKNWEFKIQGPCGGYADKSDRLRPFVQILKSQSF